MATLVAVLPYAGTPAGLLVWVVAAGLLVFVAERAVDVVLSLQWTIVGRRMVYGLAGDLFARAQRRSLTAHATHPVGDSMGRIAVRRLVGAHHRRHAGHRPRPRADRHAGDGGGDAAARSPA